MIAIDQELRVGTAFDGIDCPIWAMEQLGIPYVHEWGCEIDKFARKTIGANYKPYRHKLYNSIQEMAEDKENLPPVDIFIAGFPCQPYSQGGEQLGLNDPRAQVIFPMLEVVKHVRPPVVLFENVKGFITNKKFRAPQRTIFDTLSKEGYAIKHKILNARHYGIPQNRERTFILGFLNHSDWMHFQFPEPIPLELRLRDMLETYVDEKYVISETMIKWFEEKKAKDKSNNKQWSYNIGKLDSYVKTIPAGYAKDGSECLIDVLPCEFDKATSDHGRRVYGVKGVAPTITTGTGGYHTPKVMLDHDDIEIMCGQPRDGDPKKGGTGILSRNDGVTYAVTTNKNNNILVIGQCANQGSQSGRVYDTNGNAPALCSGHHGYAMGVFADVDQKIYRRLTPREVLRLFDIDDRFLIVVSDTQMYRQGGNGIPLNLIKAIFICLYTWPGKK